MRTLKKTLLYSLVASLVTVSGCGSSGDSKSADSATSGFQELAVGQISAARQYDEGEVVTVTVPVENPANLSIQYDWRVTHKGLSLSFTGQNSPTILFTAPQVEEDGVVSITLTLSLADGQLLGDDRRFGGVSIADLNPNRRNQIAGSAFRYKGPEVITFDDTGFGDSASWHYTIYFTDDVELEGETWERHQSLMGTGYTKINDEGDHSWGYCGENSGESLLDTVNFPPIIPEQCLLNEVTQKRYQEGNNFWVEYYCADTIISARSYRYLEEGINNYANLTFSTTFPSENYSDNETCVDLYRSLFASDAYSNIIEFSTIELYGTIAEDAYTMEFNFEGENFGVDSFGFNSFLPLYAANSFSLNWDPLSSFSGIEEDDGDLTVTEAGSDGSFEAYFDMDLVNSENQDQTIEGNITLDLP